MLNFWVFNASSKIVNQDGTPTQSFYDFCRQVWNNLGGGGSSSVDEQVEANRLAIAQEVLNRSDADSNLQTQINGKQAQLTTAQLDAVNSGVTSATVAQVGTNTGDIGSINGTIGGYGDIVTHNASEFVAYENPLPAKIAAPTGGLTEDTEARTAINAIIAVLEQYGLTENM